HVRNAAGQIVDRRSRRVVAPPDAGHALDGGPRAPLDRRLDRRRGALTVPEPARHVPAQRDLERVRGLGAVVRVERQKPLELVERPLGAPRESLEVLAAEPPVRVLQLVQLVDERAPHARSTRTAQNLNSGIFPKGSRASFVSRLAAASRKWKGMKQAPSHSRSDSFALIRISPRRDATVT